ncbi:exported hypothetical protein [Tenacibaculum sp. 190524A02b]
MRKTLILITGFLLSLSTMGQFKTPKPETFPTWMTTPNGNIKSIPRNVRIGADWMTKYWDFIKHTKINDMFLLGSHHLSYNDDGLSVTLCKPQNETVSVQIEGGVRYGDVRFHFTDDGNNSHFNADHGSLCQADGSKFKDDLKAIKNVLGKNDFFIFHMKQVYNLEGRRKKVHFYLKKALIEVFGDDVITPKELKDANLKPNTATLNQLRKYGKILFFSPEVGGTLENPMVKDINDNEIESAIFYTPKGTKVIGDETYNNIGNIISYPYKSFAFNERDKSYHYWLKFVKNNNLEFLSSLGFSANTSTNIPKTGDKWNSGITEIIKGSTPLHTLVMEAKKGFIINIDGVESHSASSRAMTPIFIESMINRARPPMPIDIRSDVDGSYRLEVPNYKFWSQNTTIEIWRYNDIDNSIWEKEKELTLNTGGSTNIISVKGNAYYYIVNKRSRLRTSVFKVGDRPNIPNNPAVPSTGEGNGKTIFSLTFDNNLTSVPDNYNFKKQEISTKPIKFVSGKFNQAISVSSQNYLQVLNKSNKSVNIDISNDITVSAWVKRTDDELCTIASGQYTSNDVSILSMGYNRNGQIFLRDRKTDGFFDSYPILSATTVPKNKWVNITFIRKGSEVIAYLNGNEVGKGIWRGNKNWRINEVAKSWHNTTQFDYIKVVNKALSVTEIKNIVQPPSIGSISTESLIYHFPMDKYQKDAAGNQITGIYDASEKIYSLPENLIPNAQHDFVRNAPFTGNIPLSPTNSPYATLGYTIEGENKQATLNFSQPSPELNSTFTIASWVAFANSFEVNTSLIGSNFTNGINFYEGIPRLLADNKTIVSSNQKVNLNTWYHIAVTRDSNNKVSIYINGKLTGTATWSGKFILGGIGNSLLSGSTQGVSVDDLRIYNTNLSAWQLSSLPGMNTLNQRPIAKREIASSIIKQPKESASENEIKLYPNPANNAVFVSTFSSKREALKIEIYNTQGKLKHQDNLELIEGNNKIQLNLSSIANGIYTIRLVKSSGITTKKLIIQK